MSGPLERIKYSKAGRPTWVFGSKFTLYSSASGEWQKARDTGSAAVGLFYTNMAKKTVAKYGWTFDLQKCDKDCPDPQPDEWSNILDTTGLTEDEIQRRREYFKDVRYKINLWYLSYYGQVTNTDDQAMEVQKMLTKMADEIPAAPRRKQLIQLYSAKYYKTKGIKAVVDELWPVESKKPTPPGVKKMTRLDYSNKVTAEYFARESPEFHKQLEMDRDEQHKREMEEHRAKLELIDKPPMTAGDYHAALAQSAAFLQPLADLAAKRFGAAVSILMVTPIGTANGNIEMRSVHSGVTKTLNPQLWPQYDELGFDAVQASFVNFGRQVFTKNDQESRILPSTPSKTHDIMALPDLTYLPELTYPSSETPNTEDASAPDGGLDHMLTSSTGSTDDHPPPPETPNTTGTTIPVTNSELTRMLMDSSAYPAGAGVGTAGAGTGTFGAEADEGVGIDDLGAGRHPYDFSGDDGFFALLNGGSLDLSTLFPPPTGPSGSRDDDAVMTTHPVPHGASHDVPSILPPGMGAAPGFPHPSRPSSPTPLQSWLLPPPPSSSAPSQGAMHAPVMEGIPPAVMTAYAPVLERASCWGPTWSQCVSAFITFERSREFDMASHKLPQSSQRPSAPFKKWNTLRRPSSGPEWENLGTGDGTVFGNTWWAWWVQIQPPGRREEGSFALARRDAGPITWTRLNKSGPDGLFLVLVGLVWWKMMIGSEDANWCKAVVDVTWALYEMTGVPVPTKRKRKTATEDDGAPAPKKKLTVPAPPVLSEPAAVSSHLRTDRKKSKKARGIAL